MVEKNSHSGSNDDLTEYKENLTQLEKETLEQISDLLKQEEKRKAELLLKSLKTKT